MQHEIDAVQKAAALRPVIDGFLEGHHDEPQALKIAGHALIHIGHQLQVCRINREVAA